MANWEVITRTGFGRSVFALGSRSKRTVLKPLSIGLAFSAMLGLPALAVSQTPASVSPPASSSSVLNTTTEAKLTLDAQDAAAKDPFNSKLRQSMRDSADPISVILATNTTTVPKALGDWLVKIQGSKGKVLLKTTNLGLGKILGKVVSGAVCKAAPGIACDLVIETATSVQLTSKKYNAIVLIAQQKQVDCVVGVKFYLRNGEEWNSAASGAVAAPPLPKQNFGTPASAITTCPFAVQ